MQSSAFAASSTAMPFASSGTETVHSATVAPASYSTRSTWSVTDTFGTARAGTAAARIAIVTTAMLAATPRRDGFRSAREDRTTETKIPLPSGKGCEMRVLRMLLPLSLEGRIRSYADGGYPGSPLRLRRCDLQLRDSAGLRTPFVPCARPPHREGRSAPGSVRTARAHPLLGWTRWTPPSHVPLVAAFSR